MAKEIYYTVNDELKEKGNDIFYCFCPSLSSCLLFFAEEVFDFY